MEMIGLNLNEKLLLNLSNAKTSHDILIESATMKKYNESLINATEVLDIALKANDCTTILELEKIAQEQDLSRVVIDKEKKIQALTILISIQEMYEKGKNPEYSRSLYDRAYSNVEKKPKEFIDKQMETSIKSVCLTLRELSRGLANTFESEYYTKRQKCLRVVGIEHKKNMNKYL